MPTLRGAPIEPLDDTLESVDGRFRPCRRGLGPRGRGFRAAGGVLGPPGDRVIGPSPAHQHGDEDRGARGGPHAQDGRSRCRCSQDRRGGDTTPDGK